MVVMDLVKAFVKANISLEKVNALQPFFRKYCREGGAVPQADALRRNYLPEIYRQHIEDLKEILRINRHHDNTRLVAVDYLNSVNNVTIGQLIVRTLIEWSLPFNFSRLPVSDSESYMEKCYREVLKPIMPQLIHSPCLAHILNLISKNLLANIKKTFVLAKARRARYLLFLSRNGVQNPTSVPLSVATRWNSWFKMAFYVNDHYQYLRNFYLEEQKNDSNDVIENMQENLPLFPFIEGRLEQLDAYINNGIMMKNFDGSLITLIQNLNFSPESFHSIFKSAFDVAVTKYRDHILNHSRHELFKAAQIFDPKFIILTSNLDILSYSTFIVEFTNPSCDLLQEWTIYCNFDLHLIEYLNLEEFWKNVERSFSVYNNISGEDRKNLSQDSLQMLNTLYYNRM
ncbi:hypothetical protein C1645_824518 [Glomus cerebriforme]|uniref:DUF659 domain-containing protein n=1 Tax=Glomus cerebriforme TaxID=658196 RepID=A0A397T079_9GLOM|nr:hypothetical protein C1645_824518 [Glomus cerebriforme]